MASSLTTSGFRPPFWPYRAGTSQVDSGAITGEIFTNTNTFFDSELTSVEITGGLFQDSDSLFQGVVVNRGEISGNLLGDNIAVLDSVISTSGAMLTHSISIPNSSNTIGRLVVVCIAADDTPTFTFPSGWTELIDTSATNVALGVAYRVVDGTEGFDGSVDTISVVLSDIQPIAYISYLIENFNSSNIESSSTSGLSNNPNPPSITPAGGYDNYVNIAINAHDHGSTTTTGFPAGYNNTQQTTIETTTGCGIGGAQLITVDSSEDPGVFTIDAPRDWIAATISIRSLEVSIENIFNQGFITRDLRGSLFTSTDTLNGGDVYFGTCLSSAEFGLDGPSEDPGVYTLSQSQDWIACTLSIKGA